MGMYCFTNISVLQRPTYHVASHSCLSDFHFKAIKNLKKLYAAQTKFAMKIIGITITFLLSINSVNPDRLVPNSPNLVENNSVHISVT